MIIERKQYEALSNEDKKKLEYCNPCKTNDPDYIRVSEIFDVDLGYWMRILSKSEL